MFQSTSHKLFRPISSLGKFKIHQSLPLSPRESKQLLNLLTTSFRQQLDQEHGGLVSEEEKRSGAVRQTKRRPSQSNEDIRKPVDHHLHSILTDPLFIYKSSHDQDNNKVEVSAPKDPMHVFDEACARGLMKAEYAKACLLAKKRSITQSSVTSISDAMKRSGGGTKVLKWMSANGLVNAQTFQEETALVSILVEFLVAEGGHEIVWRWTRDGLRRYQIALKESRPTMHLELGMALHLLHDFVKAQAASSLTLDSAYKTIFKAREYLRKWDCPTFSVLSTAGCWLSHQTCMKSAKYLPPTLENFDLFLSTVPAFTRFHPLHNAHLQLYRPTSATAGPALQFFRNTSNFTKPQRYHHTEWRRIALGLDAAKLLLEQGSLADAKWIMNFLQSKYPQKLGLGDRTAHEFELAKAEASNLELLQGLNFA